MNISYDHYRVFYYAAKCQNITQAAAVLRNNQPNISRAIRNLEQELGCTLFFRSRHGVRLTPEGERLYKHISIAFAHIEAGEEEMASLQTLRQERVTVGASEIALQCLLLPVLKEFHRLYPGIHIRLYNYTTPQAVSAVKNGLIDFAVVTTQTDISEGLVRVNLKEIPEIAVCGRACSELAAEQVSLAELTKYPLVCLGEQTMTYGFYSELFNRMGLNFEPSVKAATVDQILLLVENDLGVGFIPKDLLKVTGKSESVRVLKLKETLPSRKICFIRHSQISLSAAARRLEELLLPG